MSDNVAAGRNTGLKYEAETKDFWYQMCVMFDADKITKYDNCMTSFLDHPDSGPNVRNDNKYRKKMSRYYKQFKAGKLTAGMGKRKRHRPPKHLDVETALVKELQYRRIFEEESITKTEMLQIAIRIAEELGKKDTFKASHCWLENVLRRMQREWENTIFDIEDDPFEQDALSCHVLQESIQHDALHGTWFDPEKAMVNESQDVVALHKSPDSRSERRNRDATRAAALASLSPSSNSSMRSHKSRRVTALATAPGAAAGEQAYDALLSRSSGSSSRSCKSRSSRKNRRTTPATIPRTVHVAPGDGKALFETEDEYFAPTAAAATLAAQESVSKIKTADCGTAVPPKVKKGTLDGFIGPSLRAGDDDKLAIAIAVEEDDDGLDDNMGLPVRLECDTDAKPTILKNVRLRYVIAAVLSLIIIIVVGILSAVVFKPEPSAWTTYNPTKAPSNAPSLSENGEYRAQFLPNVGQAVNVAGTPQDRAARWIIEEDPMQLSMDSDFLVQRYLLAVFYFSTTNNGENPWRSCNPLGPDSDETECDFLVRDRRSTYASVPSHRWLSATHECEWAGVLCGDLLVVRALELTGQNFTGTLPTVLSAFDVLQSINLAYNEFTGTLPSEYARMRHLLNLDVHGNNLSGEIPNVYFQATSLQNLNFGDNMFSGTLNTEVGQLTNLKGFHSYQNMFTGTFPEELAKLRFLLFSRNHENKFEGTIPTVLGELTLLRELWMNGNNFVGTLPSEIGRLNDMVDLCFHENKLTGTIPDEFFHLAFMFHCDLSGNYLTGTLSTLVGHLVEMEKLRLSRNKLTGTIPTEIALMAQLQVGWFHSNDMVGSVPIEVCSLRPSPLLMLLADCHPEGNTPNECECCSACCNRETGVCQFS